MNYWVHTKYLLVEGKKMSKSLGNFYTIRDLLSQGWKGNEIRLALLSAHYRSALDFSLAALEQARASIARITEAKRACEAIEFDTPNGWAESYRKKFTQSLEDDLNVSEALAAAFEITTAILKLSAENKLDSETAASALDFFENDVTAIFDCFPEEVEISSDNQKKIDNLLAQRKVARAAKNWEESDRLRDELFAKFNVEVRDSADGQMWNVK